ncbi:MAG TPA: VCBS repeat-containing protein [Chloroflexota bacterium]|nr:VCBS repeat-containing protein [Chloroflexota bacterium]
MQQRFLLVIIVIGGLIMGIQWWSHTIVPPVAAGGIAAPVLKWQLGGCNGIWCETGWYASPAVADLDNDGAPEVLASPYALFALNGENGAIQWEVDPPGGRTWPGVVVADIDNNGDLEVVVAQGSGYLTVYDHLGNQVWSRRPETNELRGLSAYDLDADGSLELIVTVTGDEINTYIYEHDGSLRPGWPQLNNDSGYGWGVYNDNAAIGDLDGDGLGEIVVPSDVHYINAYEANGSQIQAHTMYGDKGWGKVGIWESLATELRGWGQCNGVRAESYRTNFADGPAVIADVNGDGVNEVVVTGNVYDCHAGYPPSKYIGVYIFNADRSRFNQGGFDWRTVPVDTGAPLAEDYNVIESALPNPVVADLDGDGRMEILFASYDGRLHAFWLDKTEHHNWPYNVAATGPGIRFASEPVVADLDNDGFAEVIFTSWPQKSGNYTGKLHILNYQGQVIHAIDLPAASGNPSWNGALGAPTIANIDADADLELVLNTAHAGVVAYDLPGTANARILWGTGRGNYQRTGSFLVGSLRNASVSATPATPAAGELVTYTIHLKNSGPLLPGVNMTSTIPVDTTFAGELTASSGTAVYAAGQVTWSGAVAGQMPVTIRYAVRINDDVTASQAIWSTTLVNDGQGNMHTLTALVIANGQSAYLPVALRP